MAEVTPPLFMDVSSVYSGDELGLPYRDFVSEGTVTAGSLAVSEKAGGANLSVDVAAGACWVLGDTNTDRQPCYRCINDAVKNLGISPDPSNPRKVLVVAQVTDETFAGTGRKWELVAIHGTPAGSPTEPALPASALPLALIDVTAADASIVNAQITDRRVRARVGGGTVLQSPASFVGARAQKSASQAFANGSDVALQFDGSDVFDTDSIHDPATNNSRFTIPSGKTGKWRFTVEALTWSANPSNALYGYKVNGGAVTNFRQMLADERRPSYVLGPIALTAGDYLELTANQNSGGSLNITAGICVAEFCGA